MEYTSAVVSKCTPEVWERIINRAVLDAEGGDKTAREWLEKYVVGAPPQMIDLPRAQIDMLAFVINSLKERGGDLSDALQMMVEIVNAKLDKADSA